MRPECGVSSVVSIPGNSEKKGKENRQNKQTNKEIKCVGVFYFTEYAY